ncbi:Rhodanese-like domain-containing protein [Chytridium lagenaria]|nr:Rhodanese-like domain-containing protein [Chytridium lagenaria]
MPSKPIMRVIRASPLFIRDISTPYHMRIPLLRFNSSSSASSSAHAFPLVSTDWLHNELSQPQHRIVPIDCSWFKPVRLRRSSTRSKRAQWKEMAMDEEDLKYFPAYRRSLEQGDEEVAWEDEQRDVKQEFMDLRIPGAKFFDINEIRDPLSSLPNIFLSQTNSMGVSDQDHVVLYDSAGIMTSPRAWWMFKAMGHKRASVLDGGLPKWVSENRALANADTEKGKEVSTKTEYTPDADPKIAVSYSDMLVHAVDFLYPEHPVIVDCRPSGRFEAADAELIPGLSNGRIPGSVNLDWRHLVNLETGTLRHPLDIIRFLKPACLGKIRVSLYDGGWIEWAGKKKSPIAVF